MKKGIVLLLVMLSGCVQQFEDKEYHTAHLDTVYVRNSAVRVELSDQDQLLYDSVRYELDQLLIDSTAEDIEVVLAAVVDSITARDYELSHQ